MSQVLEDTRDHTGNDSLLGADSILHALSDRFSRMILLSTIERARSVEDLSRENNIPLSTCYRRVTQLSKSGVLVTERVVITPEGKKHILYRAAAKRVRIEFALGHLEVSVAPNDDVAGKLYSRWLANRFDPISSNATV